MTHIKVTVKCNEGGEGERVEIGCLTKADEDATELEKSVAGAILEGLGVVLEEMAKMESVARSEMVTFDNPNEELKQRLLARFHGGKE